MKSWNKIIWLSVWVLLLIVALIFRSLLWGVGFEYDEIFTAVTSNPKLSWWWIVNNWLLIDVHPPLHNFLLYIWNHFTPYGIEVWLRLPSVIMATIALFLAWALFPRRWGKMARMAFLLLMATHGYSVIYSQHARPYALITILSVPLTFLFLKFSRLTVHRHAISKGSWALFGMLSLLLCWTHYFGALFFGLISVLLFVQAWRYKRPLLPFILVPGLVVLFFLPWLVPNLWINMGIRRFGHLHRFGAGWWGNGHPWSGVPFEFMVFFFSSITGACILPFLCAVGIIQRLWGPCKMKKFAYGREILLLAVVVFTVVGLDLLVSLKMRIFFGRYFMSILPSFYLMVSLLIAPLLRKFNWACLLLTVVLIMALFIFYREYPSFLHPYRFTARICAQYWKDLHPGEDLYVASINDFPPPTMDAMYGFYLNEVWHKNIRVKEIYQLPEEEREEILNQHPNVLIFAPSCEDNKIEYFNRKWNRLILVYDRLGGSCFIKLSERGATKPPASWHIMEAKGEEK